MNVYIVFWDGILSTVYASLAAAKRAHPGDWQIVPGSGRPGTLQCGDLMMVVHPVLGIGGSFTLDIYNERVERGEVWATR